MQAAGAQFASVVAAACSPRRRQRASREAAEAFSSPCSPPTKAPTTPSAPPPLASTLSLPMLSPELMPPPSPRDLRQSKRARLMAAPDPRAAHFKCLEDVHDQAELEGISMGQQNEGISKRTRLEMMSNEVVSGLGDELVLLGKPLALDGRPPAYVLRPKDEDHRSGRSTADSVGYPKSSISSAQSTASSSEEPISGAVRSRRCSTLLRLAAHAHGHSTTISTGTNHANRIESRCFSLAHRTLGATRDLLGGARTAAPSRRPASRRSARTTASTRSIGTYTAARAT